MQLLHTYSERWATRHVVLSQKTMATTTPIGLCNLRCTPKSGSRKLSRSEQPKNLPFCRNVDHLCRWLGWEPWHSHYLSTYRNHKAGTVCNTDFSDLYGV